MLFLVAAILLALFVVVELAVERPLLDLRMPRTRTFDISLLLIASIMVGMFVVTLYVPLFLQNIQGLSALNAGLDPVAAGGGHRGGDVGRRAGRPAAGSGNVTVH
jgi:hypothetical protein